MLNFLSASASHVVITGCDLAEDQNFPARNVADPLQSKPVQQCFRRPLLFTLGVACLAGWLLAATSPAYGQIDRGAIVGQITDPTGAVVPGAKIQVTNVNTNTQSPWKPTIKAFTRHRTCPGDLPCRGFEGRVQNGNKCGGRVGFFDHSPCGHQA